MKLQSKEVLGIAGGIASTLTATIVAIGIGVPFIQTLRDKRRKVIKKATGELGKNDASKYWRDVLPSLHPNSFPKDWCGGFALWTLHQAGLAKDWSWEIGKGFLYRLPITKLPRPGDIAYFDTNQHQALVKSLNADGTVTLINGNGIGQQVTTSTKPTSSVRAFYSIQPLIDAA